MRQIFTLIYLVFSILCTQSQVYNDIPKPILSKHSVAEKIYLQIDNALYQTGETIWFKAVVVKSHDNSPSDLSKILHVELIDSNGNLIEHKLLKLIGGLAEGSFNLEKSYEQGKYQIRAYTHWNRNFGDDFMFYQPIEVFNLKEETEKQKAIINIAVGLGEYTSIEADINPKVINNDFKGKLNLFIDTGKSLDSVLLEKTKEGIYRLDYKLPEDATVAELKFKVAPKNRFEFNKTKENFYSETVIIDEDHLDFHFFPEGGKLVNGLLSTVGFKALDYNGKGRKVEGTIKNSKGNPITAFKSNDLGMGTLKLRPKLGLTYYAEIRNNDIIYKYNLPIPYNSGSVLTVANIKDELMLSITSKNQKSKFFILEVSSKGTKHQSFRFKQKQTITTSIPKKSLPDGIIKISVSNDKNQTVCERLFFNYRDDNRLKLGLNSDKINYVQREKVKMEVVLDSAQLGNNTNLSILVVDKKRSENSKELKSNIVSHLLLNSELKGFIERPDSYFEASNPRGYSDLDALMLTQGWRNYNYTTVSPLTTFEHQPETHLKLSGTIGEYFNPRKRPKNPLDLNLIVQDEIPQINSIEIPESGKYYFALDDIYKGSTEFFMQVVDKKGEPIDFSINLDKKWQPKIKSLQQQLFSLPSEVKSNFKAEMETVNEIQKKYETAFNTIALDEVNVKGYKMTPEREKFIDLHGEPDVVIDGKKLSENAPDWSHGVFSVLKAQYGDVIQVLYTETKPPWLYVWDRRVDWTYVLIDNIPVNIEDYSLIQDIPADEVESIDINRNPKDKNRYCTDTFPGIRYCPQSAILVNIYTKSGKGLFGISKAKGVLINEIQGFSESVEFYAPNYETLTNQDWVIPDNRSVIHWEPNITLNKEGKYFLEFYNDDHVGEVSVIVEAISEDGKIGYIEKTYTIKEVEQ
ncbi:MAG: hypothetical protein HRU49_14035 [Winogradskyella sp.]|uniref:MG2 domain-containing protein n=1 Tax=Winogradskyella sp. TaxID=1883156 RepID=UPI002600E2C6|nr:MG2 domain-containing protein [Winogradskyella sp.]NRB84871.1 hypothetical protein [Winogradskyella sp.]